jgi:cytochrome c oxidase assembly protein subunit 15
VRKRNIEAHARVRREEIDRNVILTSARVLPCSSHARTRFLGALTAAPQFSHARRLAVQLFSGTAAGPGRPCVAGSRKYNRSVDPRRRFSIWALSLVVTSVLVILWGAVVRVTGSGAGCADHWPLCNGEFIPRSPALATLIELTHRVTSSLAGLLSCVVFWLSRRCFEAGSQVRKAAAWGLGLMLVEGAIGALLVKRGLVAKDASAARAFVVALHLGNTFLLLAAQVVTLQLARHPAALRLRGHGNLPWLLGGALALVLLVAASGAVTALGDTLFPAVSLAQGVADDLSAQAHFLIRLRVWHPLLAVLAGAIVVYLAQHVRAVCATPGAQRWANLVSWAYLGQLAVGSLNLLLLAPAGVQILHLLLADLTWIALVQLCLAALGRSERERAQLSLESAAS